MAGASLSFAATVTPGKMGEGEDESEDVGEGEFVERAWILPDRLPKVARGLGDVVTVLLYAERDEEEVTKDEVVETPFGLEESLVGEVKFGSACRSGDFNGLPVRAEQN